MMNKFAGYLKDRYGAWGWMGQRAHDASGINRILPLDFIISCDYGQDVPMFFPSNDIFSMEKGSSLRQNWSNEHLESSMNMDLGKEIFRRFKRTRKNVNILSYRSVKSLDFPGKPRTYAMPGKLKRHFDNKILLYNSLQGLGLSRIEGKVGYSAEYEFNDLVQEFGLPFVAQYPYGSSGQMTFFVDGEETFRRLGEMYPDGQAVFLRRLNGFSMNVNAVIISGERTSEVICSAPSIQIVGIPECSNFRSSFCGNDYGSMDAVSDRVIAQVKTASERIGKWMAEEGYSGIFGLDLMVENDSVYVVEINPRFQNSTSLYTSIETDPGNSEYSLFLLHVAEFLKDKDPAAAKYIEEAPREKFMRKVKGAQLILHNRMKRTILTGDVKAGIYRYIPGNIDFVREGALVGECGPDEFLLTCGVPFKGTVIEPNASICKLQTKENMMTPDLKDIDLRVKNIVEEVYGKMVLCDADKIETLHV